MRDTLLLMGHGTPDADGEREFCQLVGAVRGDLPDWHVDVGVLEFPNARLVSIQAAFDRCVARGSQRIAALPLLLHQAGHSKQDMPAQLDLLAQRHPGLSYNTCPFLGLDPRLLDIVDERVHQATCGLPLVASSDTAVLLVGRGASDAEANADFFKLGRLLWERRTYGFVESAFVSLAEPRVPAGVLRCVALGAKRVVVMPYFITTGVLVKRIAAQATGALAGAFEGESAVSLAFAKHLGVHPKLCDVIASRARTLLAELR